MDQLPHLCYFSISSLRVQPCWPNKLIMSHWQHTKPVQLDMGFAEGHINSQSRSVHQTRHQKSVMSKCVVPPRAQSMYFLPKHSICLVRNALIGIALCKRGIFGVLGAVSGAGSCRDDATIKKIPKKGWNSREKNLIVKRKFLFSQSQNKKFDQRQARCPGILLGECRAFFYELPVEPAQSRFWPRFRVELVQHAKLSFIIWVEPVQVAFELLNNLPVGWAGPTFLLSGRAGSTQTYLPGPSKFRLSVMNSNSLLQQIWGEPV